MACRLRPIRLNPDLPVKLEDILNKALEKDRNLRYQHAADIRTDLQRLKRDTDSGRAVAASSSSLAAAAEPIPQPSALPSAPRSAPSSRDLCAGFSRASHRVRPHAVVDTSPFRLCPARNRGRSWFPQPRFWRPC